MKISGHKTNSIYKRYDIIDEEDQRRTIEKAQEYQRAEMEKLKVISITRAKDSGKIQAKGRVSR